MLQKKPSALGKGLGALLSQEIEEQSPKASEEQQAPLTPTMRSVEHLEKLNLEKKMLLEAEGRIVKELAVGKLSSGNLEQPRKNFDQNTLQELAQSIKNYGILQPIIVTEIQPGEYKIIAGERRWRAAQIAELETVPCIVRKSAEHSALELALIENVQREDLNPVDEALAYQRLLTEHDYTHDQLAQKIGKERTTLTNSVRLLTLPAEVIDDLVQKRLSAGHGRALLALEDKKIILRARDVVISKKLSVRQTEQLVKQWKTQKTQDKSGTKFLPDLNHLCEQFKGRYSTKVRIIGDGQKGRIEINYYTADDLERLAEIMLG